MKIWYRGWKLSQILNITKYKYTNSDYHFGCIWVLSVIVVKIVITANFLFIKFMLIISLSLFVFQWYIPFTYYVHHCIVLIYTCRFPTVIYLELLYELWSNPYRIRILFNLGKILMAYFKDRLMTYFAILERVLIKTLEKKIILKEAILWRFGVFSSLLIQYLSWDSPGKSL